jgi:acyl-CoA synthetase (AMP-forming)/AMP-acid ligase II
VALVLPNGPEMIAARFAIAWAGAVAVPINVRLHARELAQGNRGVEAGATT